MAEFFGVDRSEVAKHLKNIVQSDELTESSVCAKDAHTAAAAKNYSVTFYNLDAIISVGYRVNSLRATNLRKWATTTLCNYVIKGFVSDDKRLKKWRLALAKIILKKLLERIREICVNERRFYQKITDIYNT